MNWMVCFVRRVWDDMGWGWGETYKFVIEQVIQRECLYEAGKNNDGYRSHLHFEWIHKNDKH